MIQFKSTNWVDVLLEQDIKHTQPHLTRLLYTPNTICAYKHVQHRLILKTS